MVDKLKEIHAQPSEGIRRENGRKKEVLPDPTDAPDLEKSRVGREALKKKREELSQVREGMANLLVQLAKFEILGESDSEKLSEIGDQIDDLRTKHQESQGSTREERHALFAPLEEKLQALEAKLSQQTDPQPKKAPAPRSKASARSRIARTQTPATSLAGGMSAAGASRYERVSPPAVFEDDGLSETDVAERAERVAQEIYSEVLAIDTEKLQTYLNLATPEEKAALQNPDLLDGKESRLYIRAMKKAHDVLDDLEERGRPMPELVEEDPYPRSAIERGPLGTERVMGMEVPVATRTSVRRTPQRAQPAKTSPSRLDEFDEYSGPLVSLPSSEVASWAQESLGVADVEDFFTKYESLLQDRERREDLLSQEAQAFLATHDAQDVIALMQGGIETSSQPKGIFGRIKNLFSKPAREMKVLERVVDEFRDLLLEEATPTETSPRSRRPGPRNSSNKSIFRGVANQ